MPTLTPTELTYLRDTHPHAVTMYMSIHVPAVVFRGTVTGSPARGSNQITVVTVSGDLTDAVAGQTILVGTSSGDDDVTRRRFRSQAAGVITLDENSVLWEDGQHVTILQNWELWPVFPFIMTEDPYTFFKDKDISYSDQNDASDPVAIIASNNFAGFIYGASRQFSIDGSDSYATAEGATIVSYAWSSTGGTISNPTVASTTITFTTPNSDGDWLFLTVTDSNGKSHTTRRVMFVHAKSGAHVPHANFSLQQSPTGDWNEGGWRSVIVKFIDASVARVPKGALVLLWSEEFYNGERVQIGDGRTNEMCGYIRDETITIDRASNTTTFEITTLHGLMRRHKMFSVSLEDSTAPDTWYKYKDLTVPRAVHHFWRWHSTLFDITNVFLPMSNTIRVVAVDDFVNGDLYSMVNTFALEHGIFAHVCCNKFGEVHLEVDVQMLSDTLRDGITTVMDITDEDRRDDPPLQIPRSIERSVSYVMLSGTSYDGTTSTPLIAKSPGEVPNTDGPSDISMERQVLEDQDDANEKVGRVDAVANNVFRRIPVAFAGNYSFADIVPQEWYTTTITADDNNREISIALRMLPRTVVNNYDSVAGMIMTDVIFEGEATGEDGIAGEFPVDVPPTPDPAPPSALGSLFAFDEVNGAYSRGSWVTRNGSLVGSNIQDHHGGADPYWKVKAGSNTANAILWKCNTGKIYRSANRGVSWVDKTPNTDPPNTHSDSPAPGVEDLEFVWYEGSYFTQNTHLFLARWENATNEWRSWLLMTTDDGTTWTWKSVTSPGGGELGGTCSDETPSYGTEVEFEGDPYTYFDQGISSYPYEVGYKVVARVTDTKFVIVWIYDDNGSPEVQRIMAVCGTVSGTTISLGTEVTVYTAGVASSGLSRVRAVGIHSEAVLVTFTDDADGINGTSKILVLNVSGTTLTPTTIQTFGVADNYAHNISRASDDTAILVYNDPVSQTGVFSWVGVPTSGAPTVGTPTTFINDGSEPLSMDVCALSETSFVAIWTKSPLTAYELKAICYNGSAGTAVSVTTTVSSVIDGLRIEALTATKVAISWLDTTGNGPSKIIISTVSGNTLSLGSAQTFDSGAGGTNRSNSMTVLDSSCVVLTLVVGDRGYTYIASVSGTVCTFSAANEDPPTAVAGKRPDSYSTVALSGTLVVTAYVERFTDGQGGQVFAMQIGTPASGDAYALGMSISKGDGSQVYVTYQDEIATQLVLVSFSVPGLVEIVRTPLAAATVAEITALTYSAKPRAMWFDNDKVLIYGRMLYSSTEHVLYSDDGGSTFSIVEDDWGSDYCGALDVNKLGKIHAIRNISGGGGKLYVGLGPIYPKATLPYHVRAGALVCTITGTYLVAGARTVASGDMISYGYPPYSSWLDITEDYPTDGSVTGLVIL